MSQKYRHKDPAVDNDFRQLHENVDALQSRVGDLKQCFFPNGVANSTELDCDPGWFICNGKQLACSEYSELFSILGFRYGAGVNSNLFNLPTITALDTYFGWVIRGK